MTFTPTLVAVLGDGGLIVFAAVAPRREVRAAVDTVAEVKRLTLPVVGTLEGGHVFLPVREQGVVAWLLEFDIFTMEPVVFDATKLQAIDAMTVPFHFKGSRTLDERTLSLAFVHVFTIIFLCKGEGSIFAKQKLSINSVVALASDHVEFRTVDALFSPDDVVVAFETRLFGGHAAQPIFFPHLKRVSGSIQNNHGPGPRHQIRSPLFPLRRWSRGHRPRSRRGRPPNFRDMMEADPNLFGIEFIRKGDCDGSGVVDVVDDMCSFAMPLVVLVPVNVNLFNGTVPVAHVLSERQFRHHGVGGTFQTEGSLSFERPSCLLGGLDRGLAFEHEGIDIVGEPVFEGRGGYKTRLIVCMKCHEVTVRCEMKNINHHRWEGKGRKAHGGELPSIVDSDNTMGYGRTKDRTGEGFVAALFRIATLVQEASWFPIDPVAIDGRFRAKAETHALVQGIVLFLRIHTWNGFRRHVFISIVARGEYQGLGCGGRKANLVGCEDIAKLTVWCGEGCKHACIGIHQIPPCSTRDIIATCVLDVTIGAERFVGVFILTIDMRVDGVQSTYPIVPGYGGAGILK
ncbi:MAG: hypothetical protein CL484_14755 [Acidobacteria bacterium]|nr:hypothetical protein [Acidobacteriota bacterium]